MTWVKLDDAFFRNEKVRMVGKDARALYLAGLCHCARDLTDGLVAKHWLPLLAAEAEVRPNVVKRLVDAGLWRDAGTSYEVHDFLAYNPSGEEVRALRAKRAAAGRRGGKQSGSKRGSKAKPNGQANGSANGEQPGNPVTPVPPLDCLSVEEPGFVASLPPGDGAAPPSPQERSATPGLVAGFIRDYQASHKGREPGSQLKGQACKAVKRSLEDGEDPDVIALCLGAIARENKSPSNLPYVLADYWSKEAV